MAIRQRDFLMRQVEQLAELAAAVLGRRDSVEMTEMNHELARVQASLLGPLRDGFDRLEPKSAMLLLGGVDKARLAGLVLAIEGDLREAEGDTKRAMSVRRRSLALFDAVFASDPRALTEGDRARMLEVEAKLGAG